MIDKGNNRLVQFQVNIARGVEQNEFVPKTIIISKVIVFIFCQLPVKIFYLRGNRLRLTHNDMRI